MKIFVPFDERLLQTLADCELDALGALVPFQTPTDAAKKRLVPAGCESFNRDQVCAGANEDHMGWLEVVVG